MKVQDIRSFFKQPKTDASAAATSPVVEVPSRRRTSHSKDKKSKSDSHSQSESGEDSKLVDSKQKDKDKNRSRSKDKKDVEEPTSSKSSKDKDSEKEKVADKKGSRKEEVKDKEKERSSNRKKTAAKEENNEEEKVPSKEKDRNKEKGKHDTKRKSKVLSDSEDEFDMNKSPNTSYDKSKPSSSSVEKRTKSPHKHSEVKLEAISSSRSGSSRNNKEVVKEEKISPKKGASTSSKEKTSNYETDSVKYEAPKEEKFRKASSNSTPTKKDKSSNGDTFARPKTMEKHERSVKSHSSQEVSSTVGPSTNERKPKVSKRPSNPLDDGSDSDDFNPRAKGPPMKKSKVTVPDDRKTPVRSTQVLEEKTPEQKKEQSKSNYFKFMARNQTPRNLGAKDLPIGADGCLAGLTFVMTGVLDSLERDDAKEFITKYGGRVTGSISGKTSYVIIGEDAGESKLKKAATLKVPQISEDDLLEMVRKSNPNQVDPNSSMDIKEEESPKKPERSSPRKEKESERVRKPKDATPTSSHKRDKSKEKTASSSKSVKVEQKVKPSTSSSSKPSSTHVEIQRHPPSTEPSLMWVDKYKPKALKDIVGQSGDASNAKKLLRWLKNWFQYHGSSTDKAKASWPGLKDPEGKTFKCALLSGPPGIGKTTTAHLVCREVGYDYFEMNASDTRNKRGLHEHVADALSSKTITFGSKKDELTRKHVLIMDEVDGMSGNEDRGGVQELIALIKSSRVPIICICNDRNHQKIRSLANYCYDLRFNKPTFVQLKSFMMSLCFKEKIKVPQERMQQLIKSTDQDVRQIIHQMELYKEADSDAAYNPRKDLSFGPWDVVRKVFSAPDRVGMSIHDKTGLFFQDYSLGPLFVQENYPRYVPQAAKNDAFKHMDLLKLTAESIADGDLVDSIVRRSMNWSLLPVQAVFSSFIPGEYMDGHINTNSPQFPMWLGKNSNKNKRSRLLQQLHSHMHLNVSGSLEALNMEYLPYLRRSIINPLANGDVQEAIQKMEDYTLNREDLDNINELSLWPGMRNNMDKVESKVKAAFTRQVNKEVLPYSVVKAPKARGKAKDEDEIEGLEEDDVAEVSEEDETLDKDAMVKVKTKTTSKKSVSTSKSSKTSKSKRSYEESDSEDEARTSKKSKESKKAGSSSSKSKASSSKKSRK